MIVKCEQCQTKFKIPDEKVTEKGVKVRCTKCQHTFRVKRSGNDAVPADAPLAPSPSKETLTTRAPAKRTEPKLTAAPATPSFDPSDPFAGLGGEATPASDPFALDAPATGSSLAATSKEASLTSHTAAPPPSAPPPPPTEDDPFAFNPAARPEPTQPDALPPRKPVLDGLFDEGAHDAAPSAEPDRGLFDMPAPPPEEEPAPPSIPTGSQPLARIPLAQAPVERPIGRPEDVGMDAKGPGRARQITGLVVNLVVAAVLVLGLTVVVGVYRNDGKMDSSAISADRVKSLFARSAIGVVDVSNGLYDTLGGRQVFFVRGEVENRGKRPVKIRVRAEIIDGTQVLQTAEAAAGGTPSPEDLYGLQSGQDATALNNRLDHDAVELAPGKRAPFLVTFFDYPPDLAGLRLKVTPREQSGATANAR